MSTETITTAWTPEVTTQGNYTYEFDHTRTYVISVSTAPMVVINSVLFFAIVTDVDMRKKPFFLNILSLCVWDLLMGLIALPILVDFHFRDFTWVHNQDVCRWYVIMYFSHSAVSACCIISICADRIFVKVQTTKPISIRATTIFNISVFFAPWITFFVICLPLMIHSEEDFEHNWENVCFYLFKDNHLLPAILVLSVLPIMILSIFVYAILIVYICFEGTWEKLDEDDGSSAKVEMQSLRLSTLATWIVGLMTLLLMLPLAIIEFLFVLCINRSGFCFFSYKAFLVSYTMYLTRGAITPWFWLMIPQLRKAIILMIVTIYGKIRNLWRSSSTQFDKKISEQDSVRYADN